MAWARLWDQPAPKTSQRRAFQDMGELVTLILGGNRSGKPEACAMFCVAVALGRNHWAARAFCQNNRIPLDVLPEKPGNVWAVALDSGDSREYVRPKIAKYLPAMGCNWRNRDGFGRAEVKLPPDDEGNRGRILFLSCDAGRDGMQGAAVDLVWFDEEPPKVDVVQESMMRLVDKQPVARMIISMTPLRGMSWIYDKWVSDTPADTRVHWLHGVDNPHLPPGALQKLLANYSENERAARARGEFVALEGRVYPEWRRGLHVVESFTPPDDWDRVAGIDFGTRNPTAFIMGAIDPKDSVLHIFSEHYQAEWTVKMHAEKIHQMTNHGSPAPLWIVADPADRSARLTLAREHGISTVAPKSGKNVRERINAVAERLRPDAEGRPHLVVHSNCKNTIREFESYVWQQTAGMPDKPRKVNDHAMDALGMMARHLRRGQFAVG